jgi:2'-5' RNA ligase
MPSTVRAFIGVRIPATPGIEAVLHDLAALGPSLKATNPEQLHLTLKFLGETRRSDMDAIARIMREAAGLVPRHSINIAGLGVFPSVKQPAVVWAGVSPVHYLKSLAAMLESALRPLGFAPEGRPYRPHLTLGRIKNRAPGGLTEMLLAGRETAFGQADVGAVVLYESELTPSGSRYVVLATTPLSE